MNDDEARRLLREHLLTWRARTWVELRQTLDETQVSEVRGPSGAHYQIEVAARWDGAPDGDIRVLASIDDGSWRAFKPLCEDFIKSRERQ